MLDQEKERVEELSRGELAARIENIRDGELFIVKWENSDDGKQS